MRWRRAWSQVSRSPSVASWRTCSSAARVRCGQPESAPAAGLDPRLTQRAAALFHQGFPMLARLRGFWKLDADNTGQQMVSQLFQRRPRETGLAQSQRDDAMQTCPQAGGDHERVIARCRAGVDAPLDRRHQVIKRLRARRAFEPDAHLASGPRFEQQRIVARRLQAELAVRQAARAQLCNRGCRRVFGSLQEAAELAEAAFDHCPDQSTYVRLLMDTRPAREMVRSRSA